MCHSKNMVSLECHSKYGIRSNAQLAGIRCNATFGLCCISKLIFLNFIFSRTLLPLGLVELDAEPRRTACASTSDTGAAPIPHRTSSSPTSCAQPLSASRSTSAPTLQPCQLPPATTYASRLPGPMARATTASRGQWEVSGRGLVGDQPPLVALAMACGLPPPPPPDPMARVPAASRGQGEASGVGAGRQRGWRREAAAQLVREEVAQWGTREGRRDVSHSDGAWCCAALVLLPPFSSARARVCRPEKKRRPGPIQLVLGQKRPRKCEIEEN